MSDSWDFRVEIENSVNEHLLNVAQQEVDIRAGAFCDELALKEKSRLRPAVANIIRDDFLEVARIFGDRIDPTVFIEVKDSKDYKNISIPRLILRPLVDYFNEIKYGLKHGNNGSYGSRKMGAWIIKMTTISTTYEIGVGHGTGYDDSEEYLAVGSNGRLYSNKYFSWSLAIDDDVVSIGEIDETCQPEEQPIVQYWRDLALRIANNPNDYVREFKKTTS